MLRITQLQLLDLRFFPLANGFCSVHTCVKALPQLKVSMHIYHTFYQPYRFQATALSRAG